MVDLFGKSCKLKQFGLRVYDVVFALIAVLGQVWRSKARHGRSFRNLAQPIDYLVKLVAMPDQIADYVWKR